MRSLFSAAIICSLLCLPAGGAEGLSADLQTLDSLRKGLETPLDEVDRLGKEFLEKYEAEADKAQVYFQLCHVHAQSGMKHPDRIRKYGEAALGTKLLRPDQRATTYSYLCSAHEVDGTIKDFAKRRRNAVAPLLTGLTELIAFELPELAPEFPTADKELIGDFADRAAEERARRAREEHQRRREEVQRTRELIFRRNVLRQQVKDLYARDPEALDELRELATEAIDADAAEALVKVAQAEREKRVKK